MATIDDVYNAVVASTTKVDAIKEKTDQLLFADVTVAVRAV